MIRTSDAILLKRQDLRETSLFLVLYTRACGKIYGVIKGARGQKGLYGSSPQIFSLHEVVFYERKDKEIFTVSQCELKEFFHEARESLEKTAYATYFIELINSLTPLAEANEPLYDLLEKSLHLLCSDASTKRVARIFEIKLLNTLGLSPWLKGCIQCTAPVTGAMKFSLKGGGLVCDSCAAAVGSGTPILPGTINFIEHITRSAWEKVTRIKVSQDVGQQVEGLLRGFIDYHLHLRPKSIEFMKKVLV
ncbi:MAG: DNA repair protein RecO [Candidatus Omnitrophota bacterium]